MDQRTLKLFETLTELPGVSGQEGAVRDVMRAEMTPVVDKFVSDRLGSLFGVKQGPEDGPRVMVAGHFDEVGFMVSAIREDGLLHFRTLGGWWSQTVLAQRVQIWTTNGPVIGVIASTPVHLLDEKERNQAVKLKDMRIDIGARDREHAIAIGIVPGQAITPICPFTPLADGARIMAKAWDNRYGVGLAIQLMQGLDKQELPNTLYAGATVQEEVGLRGATTAAGLIQPDIFFALDASPANDIGQDPERFGRLGEGALLRIMDRSMVTHRGMLEYLLDIAHTRKVPYQHFISNGGTDAGAVHMHGIGVPSAVIGVCARYIHTSSSILHTADYAAAKEWLHYAVLNLDRSTMQSIIDSA